MNNDVAIFLDLDNVVIGAAEAGLTFDIALILNHIEEITEGRIVLQRAYGDWRQRPNLTRALAATGFELQSSVRLSNNSKNLADMQLVVDAMSTLVDGRIFATYVLITGDRDFAPLVQALRKRGKQVVGAGVRHTSSSSLVRLCDRYIYYDDVAKKAFKMEDAQIADLIERSLDQLLQEKEQVPASLLKQRMQALSKGAFARSPQGRRSFRKLLAEFPGQVMMQQDGTTLFVTRPGHLAAAVTEKSNPKSLTDEATNSLVDQALDDMLQDNQRVRASLFKQQLQKLSNGIFNEEAQGVDRFLKFLEMYPEKIRIEHEGTTLYVSRPGTDALDSNNEPADRMVSTVAPDNGRDGVQANSNGALSRQDAVALLGQALDHLLSNQEKVRASLLKQEMMALSKGAFNEADLGYDTYRQFLEDQSSSLRVQQRGTTLMVRRPKAYVEPKMLHAYYRTELKKLGLRVVPSQGRLAVLHDLVDLLRRQPGVPWRQLIDHLADRYRRAGQLEVSKSHIGDVLRLARRAGIIKAVNGGSLSASPVFLEVEGERSFQESVIRCDAIYLSQIMDLDQALDLEEASIALYESPDRSRYLKVILSRYVTNEQV